MDSIPDYSTEDCQPHFPRDKCGIVVCHSLHDTYAALKAIQHRGQDTAGIATRNRNGIEVLRWQGYVTNFSLKNVYRNLNGSIFLGHVRYATFGAKDRLFAGAHPRFTGGRITEYTDPPHPHLVANGARSAIVHNGTLYGAPVTEDIDTDFMLKLYGDVGVERLVQILPGSYSAAVLDMEKDEVAVFRDRHKIRPLWIGEKDGRIVAASEDIAIREIGGKPIRELKGGEVVYINSENDRIRSSLVMPGDNRICFFEFNYMANPGSVLDGRGVGSVHYKIGEELAREFRAPADFVTFIPESPETMARGYSDATGIPYEEVFYKVEKERAFLHATLDGRAQSIRKNLFVRDSVDLKGKRIIVIDDSIVRLNNAKYVVESLRKRGVEWIGLMSGTPVIGEPVDGEKRGCLFGVDMPPEDQFAIVRYGSLEGIREAANCDQLHYITLEGLERAHGTSLDNRCTYCIGGPNPIPQEELREMERELGGLYR